jgi:hypothetical protein
MGNRGLFGFRYKGKYYLFYNHWDSYLTGLGADIISQIKEAIDHNRLDEWKEKLLLLEIVNEDIEPTVEQIEKLKPFTDLTVNRRSTSDWYCLLGKCQGKLQANLDSGIYFDSGYSESDLMGDLFIEYSYVVNFDDNTLDCYCSEKEIGKFPLEALPDLPALQKIEKDLWDEENAEENAEDT